MSLFDRLIQSAVAVAAVPLFTPDRPIPWARQGLTPLTAASVSTADAAFAVEAAELGLAEVSLSRLAAGRARRAEVRAFAERMAAEHGDSNAELMGLCAAKRLTLPLTPIRADREERTRLAALAPDAFDAAYAARMVADHQRAVALFRLQRDDGRDADLTAFAVRMVPRLEDHLATALTFAGTPTVRKGRGKKPSQG